MSQDCNLNPQFCTWSFVYMKYCDGDSFSGAREGTVTFNGKALSFRGHYVLEAVFDSLAANVMQAPSPWASATDVVLSGCSAGGLSTFLHTQFVHDTYLPAGANFHSVGGAALREAQSAAWALAAAAKRARKKWSDGGAEAPSKRAAAARTARNRMTAARSARA
jgi:hypothetical protein